MPHYSDCAGSWFTSAWPGNKWWWYSANTFRVEYQEGQQKAIPFIVFPTWFNFHMRHHDPGIFYASARTYTTTEYETQFDLLNVYPTYRNICISSTFYCIPI